MTVYLFDESSNLGGDLVAPIPRPETEGCLRAFTSQGSSGGVIMEVKFLMAYAGCPLVDFAIHLKNYVYGMK